MHSIYNAGWDGFKMADIVDIDIADIVVGFQSRKASVYMASTGD